MALVPALDILEDDWQKVVIDYAQLMGWRVAHFRPAQTAQGWRTPVQADGKGFPDLVMVRDGRMVVAELKAEKGKESAEQMVWLDAIEKVEIATRQDDRVLEDGMFPAVQVFIWRPSDWAEVQEVLGDFVPDL